MGQYRGLHSLPQSPSPVSFLVALSCVLKLVGVPHGKFGKFMLVELFTKCVDAPGMSTLNIIIFNVYTGYP